MAPLPFFWEHWLLLPSCRCHLLVPALVRVRSIVPDVLLVDHLVGSPCVRVVCSCRGSLSLVIDLAVFAAEKTVTGVPSSLWLGPKTIVLILPLVPEPAHECSQGIVPRRIKLYGGSRCLHPEIAIPLHSNGYYNEKLISTFNPIPSQIV